MTAAAPPAPLAPAPVAASWSLRLPRGRTLELGGTPRVMGVLNLTPDSFSDGGLCSDPQRALERARTLLAEGAEMLDLGAESTRPAGRTYGAGAEPVPAAEELRRLLPVLERLRAETDAVLSVDTRKGEVARGALAAGADLINDVTALGDPALAAAVAAAGCPVVLMHNRGDGGTARPQARYGDVVAEVRDELAAALGRAAAAGIGHTQTLLDPGIGFAKGGRDNLLLLRHLDDLRALGRPLLVGASRKSFIGDLTGAPPAARLAGSLAAVAWAARQGAAVVRVHDVAATVQFLAVHAAIDQASGPLSP
ncbi:MAG TPA: dihydropteroate synthase [Thermoanaerobaculia bacterium]|jgi:dihydropteroate synthase|nr:dihydropteroate synthase [Thermoanaerobaculia bacterium]